VDNQWIQHFFVNTSQPSPIHQLTTAAHLVFLMMATTGYSGTPLLKKLGIQPTMKLLLVNAPSNYAALLAADISQQLCTALMIPDFIHAFVTTTKELATCINQCKKICSKNSAVIIWISWYKKAAKIPTDITEDIIRAYALANNLVDVKVCAVSDSWSGLKLVVPLAKR
jgi:hypothetical protein